MVDTSTNKFEGKTTEQALWDVAVRYQDLKRLGNITDRDKKKLQRLAIDSVLRKARSVLGSVMRPDEFKVLNMDEFVYAGARGELSLDETLAESGGQFPQVNQFRYDAKIEKKTNIAVIMDASLSMTGEKIALLGVASAVVALCVPTENLSLMGFDSRIRWIKHFDEKMSVEKVVESVLEMPSGGFTNLELALEEMTRELFAHAKPRANVILISDGKYTEGKDPTYLGEKFRHLSALKIGRDQSGKNLLVDLIAKGNGRFFEARKIEDLPRTMYSAMKALVR